MRERLRQIFRRRRMRFLKARAHRSAIAALHCMESMEADLHELHVLTTIDIKIVPLTTAEIEAAVDVIG
jgi:hypothetical protein